MKITTALLLIIFTFVAGLVSAEVITKYRQNQQVTSEKIQDLELKVLQLQFHTGYSSTPEVPPVQPLSNGMLTTE